MTKFNITNTPNRGIFTLKQCIHSPIAISNEINNFPGSDVSDYDRDLTKNKIISNLHKLFKYCVNPIYSEFGKIGLSSVYRNKELNQLLKGVEYSQHIYGYAADIVSTDPNIHTSEIWNWCKLNLPRYHQLIWEYPERGTFANEPQNNNNSFSWIHISFIEGNNFKENSVSSLNPKIHKFYEDENTYTIGNFTHGITEANQDLIEI
tara:strand:- start:1166 stop:1783 length:618 start_codon:yes stop_codon:yes gene_type:complete